MGEKRTMAASVLLFLLLTASLPMLFRLSGNLPWQNALGVVQQVQASGLTTREAQVVELVNGTEAYNYDQELEGIGLNHSVSGYSFRVAGSDGANSTAEYIMKQFQSFGLETYNESFQFTNWKLPNQPTLVIDQDGNPATTDDQVNIRSFQSTHYSWPTPEGGVFGDLVVLPLPPASSIDEIGLNPIDTNAWNAINTRGKILLIGKEVTWSGSWHQTYRNKLSAQPPAAIVLTWWYGWMAFTPIMQSSAGGRPANFWTPYYWNLQIPVGSADYDDGFWIRSRESSVNVSASFRIESVIGSGPHYNVVGKLRGYEEPNKFVIVSGHYDTVTTPGFVDNGAGTAGVIELARTMTVAVKSGLYHPKYSILFIAFTSEEIGLVGSIYYVKQHKAEMPSIAAVINLDCIGNDDFYVSTTDPDATGLDLDQLVLQAATDLGVPAGLTVTGGSDQEPFRDPVYGDNLLQYWWGINPGISDAAPVASSALLESQPLLYSDMWSTGTPGWIHTSYDNSTSTQTLNWLEIVDLENHIMIAALSVMRVSPSVLVHDIAVAEITTSKVIVGQGYSMTINVILRNLGDFDENFNVKVFANSVMVDDKPISLVSQTFTWLAFTWNTEGFSKGFYQITAEATLVPGDIDAANNMLPDGTVDVVTPGDVNADGIVGILDVSGISAHWYLGPPEGPLGYDSNFDVNNDGRIDIIEISIISAYWTGPPKGPLAP